MPAEVAVQINLEAGQRFRPYRAVLENRFGITPSGCRCRRQLLDGARKYGLPVSQPQNEYLAGLRQPDHNVFSLLRRPYFQLVQNDRIADKIQIPDIISDMLILPSDAAITGIDGNDADRIIFIVSTTDKSARVAGGDEKDIVPDIRAETGPDPHLHATLVEWPVPDKITRRHIECLQPLVKRRDIERFADRDRLQQAQTRPKQARLLAGCGVEPVHAVSRRNK